MTNLTQTKTRKLSSVAKCWELIWQTYACEEQDGRAVPLETKETYFSMKPSGSHINQLRKHAHALGYKLVAINECCLFPEVVRAKEMPKLAVASPIVVNPQGIQLVQPLLSLYNDHPKLNPNNIPKRTASICCLQCNMLVFEC